MAERVGEWKRDPAVGLTSSQRSWKRPRERSSSVKNKAVKGIRRSWADKERMKAKLNATKLREAEMKAAVAEEQTAKKMRQKEARERREANAQKNDVVQVIKDPTKIKKMSRRQLKYIRKAALL
eukprot:TRINITY_DN1446_c0_g1_i4.p3 TRINITY_DN1446_c0_g1~~TRINITY_DN1446_c0_g1_i4.p3  ORF type:complete len:124 (-),score=53.03 TRINITY_DN1446_c0_g1_i4:83-454(-)